MAWNCPLCPLWFVTLKVLIFHVTGFHAGRDLSTNIRCGQANCQKSFGGIAQWKQHLKRIHENVDNANTPLTDPHNPEAATHEASPKLSSAANVCAEEENGDFEDIPEHSNTMPRDDDYNCIREYSIQFVSDLRSCSSVTVKTCEKAVAGCNQLVNYTVAYLKARVREATKNKISDDEWENLEAVFEVAESPLEFLSDDSKQKTFFKSMPTFVCPEKYVFGAPRYETAFDRTGEAYQKAVYDSWQYVPLKETLKVQLSQPELFENLTVIPPENGGVISDFVDGSVFRNENPVLSDPTKISTAIDLYYDDLETANPLGSKATIHKIGVFYFTIKNLPSCYNSSMANIYLLAIAYSQDLKQYGYNIVLAKFAEDLRELEEEGFQLTLNDSVHTIYATLATFNGDNLGRHAVFNFFESFNAMFFCDECEVDRKEIQEKFLESDFTIREKDRFDSQVEDVEKHPENCSKYGIKGRCALSGVSWWHITRNKVADLMHDFLEGVGPFEVKLVLNGLIKMKLFTLETLNTRLRGFPLGKTDSRNRPSAIPNVDLSSHSLKQNAFQFWCLFRILPFLIGDLIPPKNRFWEFYLDLRRCADYLFARKWTGGTVLQFQEAYAMHQQWFKSLFPGYNLITKASSAHSLRQLCIGHWASIHPYGWQPGNERELLQETGAYNVQFQKCPSHTGLENAVFRK